MAINRYIGGGRCYFSKWNGVTYDAEAEIGEVKKVTLKSDVKYTDAMSKDDGIEKKVDKVPTSSTSTISFETQNVNKANLAMAMYGTASTETFLLGATLPDGTVATVDTVLPVILGGTELLIEGKFRFVGVNTTGGDDPVLEVHHAVITASGNARDYFADKHATLAFDGEIIMLADKTEYYKEYLIPNI